MRRNSRGWSHVRLAFSSPSVMTTTSWQLVGGVAAARLDAVEQPTDGVVERCRPSWFEPLGDRAHLDEWPGIDDDVVRRQIVELDDRDRGVAGDRALLGEEAVEANDDLAGDAGHGAGAVEQEPDLGART